MQRASRMRSKRILIRIAAPDGEADQDQLPARVGCPQPSVGSLPMATRSANPRPARGDGRVALLDAAIRVGAQQGLRGLTIRSVAAEAGVTHGLVYHHFRSRDRLIAEALVHAGQRSLGTGDLEPGTGRPEDFSADLEQMVADDPDLQAFQFELLLEARRTQELLPTVAGLYEEYREATRRRARSHGASRRWHPGPRGLCHVRWVGPATGRVRR